MLTRFNPSAILLYFCFIHCCICSRAQELSGVDLSVDFGAFQTSFNREVFILKKLVDQEQVVRSITPGFSYASFVRSSLKVNAELVFTGKPVILKSCFHNSELKVGFSFLTSNGSLNDNSIITYDSLDANNIKYTKVVSYNFYFHQEQIQCTYLFNSRVFRKNFRMYTGLGGVFSIGTWKGARRNTISSLKIGEYAQYSFIPTSSYYPLKSYSANSLSLFVPIGLKYNLSCDLNLFSDLKFGMHYTPVFDKNIRTQRFFSFCIGFRYKLNQAEPDQDKNTSFW